MPPNQTQTPTPQNQANFLDSYSPDGVDPAKRKRKILIIVIAVALVLAIMLTIANMFSGGGIKSELSQIIAQEQELARVAEFGIEEPNARTTTHDIAATVRNVTLSNAEQLTALHESRFGGVDKKLIEQAVNSTTDTELKEAAQTNTFDKTFADILEEQLTAVNANLSAAFDKSNHNETKSLLSTLYNNNKTLLKSL